jgi:hypothetical protein
MNEYPIDDHECNYCDKPATHEAGGLYLCADHSLIECKSCHTFFDPADFDDIDDEFNEDRPKCPECQENADLENKECEHCDNPAVAHTDSGYLCEDHYANYVKGYIRED